MAAFGTTSITNSAPAGGLFATSGTTVASSTKLAANSICALPADREETALVRPGGKDRKRRCRDDKAETPVECRRFFDVPYQMADMMQTADVALHAASLPRQPSADRTGC
jgi:hypothetical protein